ncbi:hypothetical protein [Qipengyuania flava]|uniref:hypothetical protein n=1 Tax=Qipengyuania flava TaxID=192812 RepID=UPI001C63438F|nr:hypothetical protein [Qipengyuania flava]QYJ06032.1 hypothetical protein KUV82_07950 [Qipengyuania flava]
MKTIALAALAALAATSATAQQDRTYSLDGGTAITLSSGWEHKQLENPAMRMASMREMMRGASETRLRKGETGVLVSYMHFKTDAPAKEMNQEELASLAELARKSAAQYLRSSVETEAAVRSAIVGNTGIAMATLTARDGESFNVRAGYPGGCVTTGSMRRGSAAWAISVASKSCESATHIEAVEALFAPSEE